MNYSEKLNQMKVLELREECQKYPEIELSMKDTKEVLIEKILTAYYGQKSKEPKEYVNAQVDSKPGLVFKTDAPIGLDGPMREEDFLTPDKLATKELLKSKDKNVRKILTAQLYSFEVLPDGYGNSKVYFVGQLKDSYRQILVPFEEYRLEVIDCMQDIPQAQNKAAKKNKEKLSVDEIRKYFTRRSRTSFDFIVNNFDESDDFASVLASRKDAALVSQKKFWNLLARYEDGTEDYWIRPGRKMEARIMEVESYGIVVEAYGLEFFIPKHELTYVMRENIKNKFFSGQKIQLIVKEIKRDELGNIEGLHFSHRDLLPNPKHVVERMYENLEVNGYVVDQRYDEKWGYQCYVACNGIEIMAKVDSHNDLLPSVGDYVTVKIKKIKPETGQVRGYILHVYNSPERG